MHNVTLREATFAFVTAMSSGCHIFRRGLPCACFRVRVENAVAKTLRFERHTLPFRTDFAIAGTRCLVATNSHQILSAAANWKPASTCPGGVTFEMEVIVDPSMDADPDRPTHFRGLRHLVFAFLPPRSFVTYDLRRKRVHALLSSAAADDHAFWDTLLLPITIGVLGTTIGVAPLHCACLERDGVGVLIAGVSGAGKSTLSAALAQRGFTFISDDWTYLSMSPSGLAAHGLSAPLKLLPDTVRFFPQLRNFSPGRSLNGEMAYEVEPRGSFACRLKAVSFPHHLFFLERTLTSGFSVEACSPRFVRSFFENSGERLADELVEAKILRSEVIRALSAYPCWIEQRGVAGGNRPRS